MSRKRKKRTVRETMPQTVEIINITQRKRSVITIEPLLPSKVKKNPVSGSEANKNAIYDDGDPTS